MPRKFKEENIQQEKKTFYIRLSGYADTTLEVYKIEASSFEEAKRIAITQYVSDIDVEEISEEGYLAESIY